MLNRSIATLRASAIALGCVVVANAPAVFGCGEERRETFVPPVESPPLGPTAPNDAGTPLPSCGSFCSSDLHRVVDCRGRLVTQCEEAKACNPKTADCEMAPCDAAAQAKGTAGCEFFLAPPAFYSATPPAIHPTNTNCYAVAVTNTWGHDVTLGLSRGATVYDVGTVGRSVSGSGANLVYKNFGAGKLSPGATAVLFLADSGNDATTRNCPFGTTPAAESFVFPRASGAGEAFRLTSSAPVSVVDFAAYANGRRATTTFSQPYDTSAVGLLPTSAWGTSHVIVNHARRHPYLDGVTLAIVAKEATKVTIVPTADLSNVDAFVGTPKGVGKDYPLAAGAILYVAQSTAFDGTIVRSDKPIAVLSGGQYRRQEILSDDLLGNEYVAVRPRNRYDERNENPAWRMVGVSDGVTLTYVPAAPSGAPTTLARGEVVTFRTPTPFVVKSQDEAHKFAISAEMTTYEEVGQGYEDSRYMPDGVVSFRGNAQFQLLAPRRRFADHHGFFLDPSFPDTELVVIRAKDRTGAFPPVALACGGTLRGFKALGDDYEYARVDLVHGGRVVHPGCDTGTMDLRGGGAFTVNAWAWGPTIAYGYTPTQNEPPVVIERQVPR